jgi:hypothetical protein
MFPIKPPVPARLSGTPNQRFVTRLYTDLFQRQPDSATVARLVKMLDAGIPRSAVVQSLKTAATPGGGSTNEVYMRYLKRPATHAELVQWSSQLQAGKPVSALVEFVLNTPEYFKLATS